jgi:imidazolonepropionase
MDNLLLYTDIAQCVTMEGVAKKNGRHPTVEDLGIIEDAAVVVDAEKNTIAWLGARDDLPSEYEDILHTASGDFGVWLPELVECHTHLVYAGDRHQDYGLRCQGKTYQEVAESGGGILSTIIHTRETSEGELLELGMAEVDRFQKYGIGTLEIKSGYGLSLESELKILRVIRILSTETSVTIIPTFMPAHATPPEFKDDTEGYVDVICKEWIPAVAEEKLAVFFDAFVEKGYFTVEQTRRMCEVAKEHGMKIKLHADQFTELGGTDLAIELGAQSVDHLDHISDAAVKKLAASDTVAVLLPGASLFTGTSYPPARKLIDAGARVAISTDYNPGTCPSRNLPLMTTIACSQMKMTIAEALTAITYNAAAALGLEKELGALQVGKPFRICQLRTSSYEALPYCFGELE